MKKQTNIFTLSIGTLYLLTILVLKFEIVHSVCHLLICLKYCCMYGKQCRSWSDAVFSGIWSGSTLFAKAYLSRYLGSMGSTSCVGDSAFHDVRSFFIGLVSTSCVRVYGFYILCRRMLVQTRTESQKDMFGLVYQDFNLRYQCSWKWALSVISRCHCNKTGRLLKSTSMLGKNFSILKYFSYFSQKIGFDISCKLSSKETVCMKFQSLITGETITKKIFYTIACKLFPQCWGFQQTTICNNFIFFKENSFDVSCKLSP